MAKASDKAGKGDSAEALTFEQAVERLEQIISQIETGELGLEKAVTEYERGVALMARCRAILDQAEQKVAELSVRAGGGKVQAPPEPAGDEPPF